MNIRRLLGLDPAGDESSQPSTAAPAPTGPTAETETVRRIVARLEALPEDRARYLAAFAYILSRAARADEDISDPETELIEGFVTEYGGLDEAQAVIVVELAKLQSRLHGATEDFLVTREFATVATEEQKLALLRCCFIVSAADDSIAAVEASVVNQIARELGVERPALNAVRAEFHEKLSAIQEMRRRAHGS